MWVYPEVSMYKDMFTIAIIIDCNDETDISSLHLNNSTFPEKKYRILFMEPRMGHFFSNIYQKRS